MIGDKQLDLFTYGLEKEKSKQTDIILCKDCVWYMPGEEYNGGKYDRCENWDGPSEAYPDGHCHFAERKKGECERFKMLDYLFNQAEKKE